MQQSTQQSILGERVATDSDFLSVGFSLGAKPVLIMAVVSGERKAHGQKGFDRGYLLIKSHFTPMFVPENDYCADAT